MRIIMNTATAITMNQALFTRCRLRGMLDENFAIGVEVKHSSLHCHKMEVGAEPALML
jgi:hypothetical protein